MARENLYSSFVFWAKILLPLLALAILSSFVFIARESGDQRTIPFVTDKGGDAAPDERLSAPEYVGVTGDGSAITLRAVTIVPVEGDTEVLDAQGVSGTILTETGRRIDAAAPAGRIDLPGNVANLIGQVDVETSDGITVVTTDLRARLDEPIAVSPGPVTGNAPFGRIEAGGLELRPDKAAGDVLVFNGGVRLIYQPGN